VASVAQPLGSGFRPRGSNSQLAIPNGLALGDFDRDGKSDFLQYWGNKLFINHTDFQQTFVTSLALPANVKRVVTGDFYDVGSLHVCPILSNGNIACYGISNDHTALWWSFNQGNFIADNEDFIVGDFNGDQKDDILVYPTGGGAYRMYTIGSNGFFGAMPSFSQGNLNSVTGSGFKVRAGDFNADGRADVAIVRPGGMLSYFGSVFDGKNDTFWWAFNTPSGFVGSSDQVSIARIDADAKDDVVLRNTSTGATRFFQMAQSGGNNLAPITGVSTGQINTQGNSSIFWGSMHDLSTSEPGSFQREDALVYLNGSNLFARSDARYDGSTFTYWWVYNQNPPKNVLHATQHLGGGSVYATVQMSLDRNGQFTINPTIENHNQITGYTYNLTCNIGMFGVGYQGHVGPASLFLASGPTRDTPGPIGVVDSAIATNWDMLTSMWQAGPGSSSFGCQLDTSSTLDQELASLAQIIVNVELKQLGLDSDGIASLSTCLATSSNKFTCGMDPRQCVTLGDEDANVDPDLECDVPSSN
jgi:hypothetical protein